jgi:hypothetical protein
VCEFTQLPALIKLVSYRPFLAYRLLLSEMHRPALGLASLLLLATSDAFSMLARTPTRPRGSAGVMSVGTPVSSASSGALREELPMNILPAGDPPGAKGMGAFAAGAAAAGTWVCQYLGTPVTLLDTAKRYVDSEPEYLFQITPDLYLDAMDSEHVSRYFNHAQHGNLNFTVNKALNRVDFYLAHDVVAGEELCFDCACAHVPVSIRIDGRCPPACACSLMVPCTQMARHTGWAVP